MPLNTKEDAEISKSPKSKNFIMLLSGVAFIALLIYIGSINNIKINLRTENRNVLSTVALTNNYYNYTTTVVEYGTESQTTPSISQNNKTESQTTLFNKPSALAPTTKPKNNYIAIGDSRNRVKEILGTPDSANSVFWYYGDSSVQFDYDGKVEGWDNAGDLNVFIGSKKTGATPIKFGSSRSEVVAAMGTPDSANTVFWYYGDSSVQFDYNGKVEGWDNSGNLIVFVGAKQAGASPIKFGSSKNEVIAAMGTPDGANTVFWYYENSSIQFDYSGHVEGWDNAGNLRLE